MTCAAHTDEMGIARDTILALPDFERAAFFYWRYEHKSIPTVALLLSHTEDEVKQALVRAVQTVQRALEAEGCEP